jgi:cytoskeleton protein RodZ
MAEIGETLRETRMRRRIDMSEVEAATKIRAKYLRALENEEWDLLPGPTFVKTFLRTYAEYLELDPRLLVEEYRQRFERPSDMANFGPGLGGQRQRQRARRRNRRPIGPIIAVALGVAVLVGALYLIGKWGNGNPSAPSTGVTATPTASATATATPARKKATKKKKAAAARVTLKLTATRPVFVCLEDATGKKLVNGSTLDTGQSTKSFRSGRFRLNLGNGGVTMTANGRRYTAADLGAPIGYELRPGRKPRRLAESVRVKLCT